MKSGERFQRWKFPVLNGIEESQRRSHPSWKRIFSVLKWKQDELQCEPPSQRGKGSFRRRMFRFLRRKVSVLRGIERFQRTGHPMLKWEDGFQRRMFPSQRGMVPFPRGLEVFQRTLGTFQRRIVLLQCIRRYATEKARSSGATRISPACSLPSSFSGRGMIRSRFDVAAPAAASQAPSLPSAPRHVVRRPLQTPRSASRSEVSGRASQPRAG